MSKKMVIRKLSIKKFHKSFRKTVDKQKWNQKGNPLKKSGQKVFCLKFVEETKRTRSSYIIPNLTTSDKAYSFQIRNESCFGIRNLFVVIYVNNVTI